MWFTVAVRIALGVLIKHKGYQPELARQGIPKARRGTHNEGEDTAMQFYHQCPDCHTPRCPTAKHFRECRDHEEALRKYLGAGH